jgi:hypothetical protein
MAYQPVTTHSDVESASTKEEEEKEKLAPQHETMGPISNSSQPLAEGETDAPFTLNHHHEPRSGKVAHAHAKSSQKQRSSKPHSCHHRRAHPFDKCCRCWHESLSNQERQMLLGAAMCCTCTACVTICPSPCACFSPCGHDICCSASCTHAVCPSGCVAWLEVCSQCTCLDATTWPCCAACHNCPTGSCTIM